MVGMLLGISFKYNSCKNSMALKCQPLCIYRFNLRVELHCLWHGHKTTVFKCRTSMQLLSSSFYNHLNRLFEPGWQWSYSSGYSRWVFKVRRLILPVHYVICTLCSAVCSLWEFQVACYAFVASWCSVFHCQTVVLIAMRDLSQSRDLQARMCLKSMQLVC